MKMQSWQEEQRGDHLSFKCMKLENMLECAVSYFPVLSVHNS